MASDTTRPQVVTPSMFAKIRAMLGQQAEDDIAWAETLGAPPSAEQFAREAIFVICNSGMRATVAQGIFERCMHALRGATPVIEVFGHVGKAAAIEHIWANQEALLSGYLEAADKLEFCASLPWIGDITKYHLAKNLGADVAKPDVHLQRLADLQGVSAQALCEGLAREVGLRVATVDTVLWRACSMGVLNSHTAELAA
jgi:hypothetical protein